MEILVVLGVAVVLLVGLIFLILRRDNSQGLDDRLKLEFQSLTQSALKESREELERELSRYASVGSQELEGKKALIDQQLYNIKAELARVTDLVRVLERDREAKFGQLTEQIRNVGEQAAALTASTGTLREALASSQARGQWGERMAEDILRLMGMKEGVNYRKQETMGRTGHDRTSASYAAGGYEAKHGREVSVGQLSPICGDWSRRWRSRPIETRSCGT